MSTAIGIGRWKDKWLTNVMQIDVVVDSISETAIERCPDVLLVVAKIVELAVISGCSHVNQILLEQMNTMERR